MKINPMLPNLKYLIKKYLKILPTNDYPKLNTRLFVSCWLHFVLDPRVESMRGLFAQLNWQGIEVDISTFSKASKNRDPFDFQKIFADLNQELKKKNKTLNLALFPIDSTIVTLTSKLFWLNKIHQVKLFAGLNSLTSKIGGVSVHFGQGHDSKYGEETIEATPENAVLVMNRGFSCLERIRQLLHNKKHYFLLRINQNVTLEEQENGFYQIGK